MFFLQIKECCDNAELIGKSGKPKAASAKAAPKAEAKKAVVKPVPAAAKAAPSAPKKVCKT